MDQYDGLTFLNSGSNSMGLAMAKAKKVRASTVTGPVIIDLAAGRIAEVIERDSDDQEKGKTVRRVVVADTLRRMEMAKTITSQQKRAGDEFRQDFQTAALSGIRQREMERIDMAWKSGEGLTAAEHCKRKVWRDIEALGGIGSIGAVAMWDIVGLEISIQEWAALRGWNRHAAGGILVAALDVIVRTRKIT